MSTHDSDHIHDCESHGEKWDPLKTPQVLVYFEGGRLDPAVFVGCHRPTHRQQLLADADDDRLLFASPVALSARRSFVGYAVRDRGRTVVEVRDLADPRGRWPCSGCEVEQPEPLRRLPAAYHPRRPVGVETLALGPEQALAWTTCRLGDKMYAYGERAYDECTRSYGTLVSVWRASASASKIKLLDQGRKIYPRTLRIERGRIHWRNGRRTRSAAI